MYLLQYAHDRTYIDQEHVLCLFIVIEYNPVKKRKKMHSITYYILEIPLHKEENAITVCKVYISINLHFIRVKEGSRGSREYF